MKSIDLDLEIAQATLEGDQVRAQMLRMLKFYQDPDKRIQFTAMARQSGKSRMLAEMYRWFTGLGIETAVVCPNAQQTSYNKTRFPDVRYANSVEGLRGERLDLTILDECYQFTDSQLETIQLATGSKIYGLGTPVL